MSGIGVTVTLAAVAVGMSLATAIMLKWSALARTGLRAVVVLFLLLMMTGMLVGAAIYFVAPSAESLVVGLWVAAALMSLAVVLVFAQFVREARSSQAAPEDYQPEPLRHVRTFQVSVVATVIANELLMGWTFQRAAGGPVWLGGGGVGDLLSNLLVSPWFVLPMAFEMTCTLVWLRLEFPKPMLGLLAFQPIVMFASPPSFSGLGWEISTAVVSSAAMAGAVGYLLVTLFRGRAVMRSILRYATALYLSFGLMAVGLATWALSGSVGVYSLAVACQMVVFLLAVVAPSRYRSKLEDVVEGSGQPEQGPALVGSEPAPSR